MSERVELSIVNPGELYDPVPNGYSHSVVAKGGSRIAYIAGQGGEDSSGTLSSSFVGQVKQAYANLQHVLNALGARPDQVAKITTYIVDYHPKMLNDMTEQLVAIFGSHLPAQTLVPVPSLALDGMLFEVEAIAILD